MADKRLKNYIKSHIRKGFDQETITEVLLDNGWHINDIQDGFQEVQRPNYGIYLVLFVSILVILSAFVFMDIYNSELSFTPVGNVILDTDTYKVKCLTNGLDDANYEVIDLDKCCFLISESKQCRLSESSSEYRDLSTKEVAGTFKYDYACFSDSTRVLFKEEIIDECRY